MKNSGFSLIEIIVVLMILGVLAALALTNLYSWIEKSKTAEAYAQIGVMTKALEACYYKESNAEACANSLNQNQAQYSTKYFNYQYYPTGSSPSGTPYNVVHVVADRNNIDINTPTEGNLSCPVLSAGAPYLSASAQHYAIGLEVYFNGGSIQTADCFMLAIN